MVIAGKNYRLSKHGRQRYIERVGMCSDAEIIRATVGDPRAVWRQNPQTGSFRLVTYLGEMPEEREDGESEYEGFVGPSERSYLRDRARHWGR